MKLKPLYLPLSIFVALGCYIYLVKPAWDGYSETKKVHEEKASDLEKMKKSKSVVDKALDGYEQEDLDNKFLLKNSIPDGLAEENFIKEIDKLVLDTGVAMKKIKLIPIEKSKRKIAEGTADQEALTTKVEIILSGNYFGLKKAVYLLENFNRLITIEELLIKLDNQSKNLELFLELNLFHEESGKKMGLSLNDFYFKDLLKNGLDLEILSDYMGYREEAINFDLIEIGEKGKDNLFGLSGAGEDNIEVIESVETNSEGNNEPQSELTDGAGNE